MGKFKNPDNRDFKKEETRTSDLFTVITEDKLSEQKKTQEQKEEAAESEETVLKELPSRVEQELQEEEAAGQGTENAFSEKKEEGSFLDSSEAADTEQPVVREHATVDSESITVITKGTTLNGSITSDCSLDVMGTINGDIECLGRLTISGKVTGNAIASEVFINADRFDGNITSEGGVKIGIGTVVIGDILASSAVIAGAVRGDLDVQGPVIIDSTAIIKGNIKAKSIQMNNGAVLEGFCSLPYATVDIDKIFE